MTRSDWVKNGDRWTVSSVHSDGSLGVVHTHTGRRITLPHVYVAAHVQLGYATTVHGAQGVTADTAHTVATGDETRQQLYVALTRGRDANHLYLVTAMDGNEHSVITPEATHPLTAVNVLERILARDEAQVSATTARQILTDPNAVLADADARYRDSLGHAAAHIHGPGWVEKLEQDLDQLISGLTDSPAWPTLRGHLALLAADGHDPVGAFSAALHRREIDSAADVAAVLDWRLDPTHTRSATPGPLPWLAGIPQRLTEHPKWGAHLTARADQIRATATTIRDMAEGYTVATAPEWARLLLGDEHRQLRGDLAVFRAAHAVPEDDARPTGRPQLAAADRRAQKGLDEAVAEAIDASYRTAWTPLAVQVGLSPRTDPHWPVLVEHLAALSRAGANAPALLRAAAAESPLPDEYQAAALWWRIARHASPAVLTPDQGSAPVDPLRPGWLPQLTAHLTPTAVPDAGRRPALAGRRHRRQPSHRPRHPRQRRRSPAGRPRRQPRPGPRPRRRPDLPGRHPHRPRPRPDPYQPADDPSDRPNSNDPGHGYEPVDPDLAPPEDLHMLTSHRR